jgi:16S rRNA (adenine1518-N6/adenine1519-N6)-dimethyltransferase
VLTGGIAIYFNPNDITMTSPRTLLNAWQVQAKKKLGQHFLVHPATAEKIVAATRIRPNDIVLEIGAGLGALTIPVARRAARVYAVETDRRITGLLKTEILAAKIDNVQIIEKNILDFDIAHLAAETGDRLVVIGNLPYHISSQVLVRLIMSRHWVDRAVLMFQKELAERLMAPPGTKTDGRITVMLAYCARIGRLADFPAESFFPRPKVDSSVLEIRFRQTLETVPRDETFLHQVIQAAFSQRRKTLKNALSGSFLDLSPEIAIKALGAAGINPIRRAETLSPNDFIRLSNCLYVVSPSAR